MSSKAFFPCAGGSNLILGIVRENQIFFLRFFHQIVFNVTHLWGASGIMGVSGVLGEYHGRHWMPHVMPPVDLDYPPHWWIQGGCQPCMPPNRIQFFHFRICFHQKVPTLEVGGPQQLGAPPNGKSWIHHCSPPSDPIIDHPTPSKSYFCPIFSTKTNVDGSIFCAKT